MTISTTELTLADIAEQIYLHLSRFREDPRQWVKEEFSSPQVIVHNRCIAIRYKHGRSPVCIKERRARAYLSHLQSGHVAKHLDVFVAPPYIYRPPIPWIVRRAIWESPCAVCLSTQDVEVDHIPLSKGGSGNIANLQPLCRRCNELKGCRLISNSQLFKMRVREGL